MKEGNLVEQEISTIEGIFKVIIFQGDNNYTVAKFILNQKDEKMMTVTGYIGEVLEDTPYRLFGEYKEHPRYGMQFDVSSYERILPNDDDSLIRYFSSSLFHGIGKKAATTLVKALGSDAIKIIKEDPEVLLQIPSLKEKQRESILEGIKNDISIDDSIVFLTQHGMTLKNIMKVEAVYENEAISIIKKNPYQMIVDIDGIGFKTADKIAKKLGFEEDHPYRMKAAVVSVMNDLAMSSGNTYMHKNEILKVMYRNFENFNEELFDEQIQDLIQERLVYVEEDCFYPIEQYDAENGIAKFLYQFPYVEYEQADEKELKKELTSLEEKFAITYEEKQKEAIQQFFAHPFSIITGGPGTGKTTIVRAIIALYKKLFPEQKISLCAPTGRAAKRLGELSQVETSTIHSLLKWDLETNRFAINEEEPLDCDLLIIDEFSMVDAWLFYNLLKASRYIGKILLIGDEDQLPSVGPGFVLKDLIASQCFQVSRLSKIFRQAEGSDVVKLAMEIKEGNCGILDTGQEAKMFTCLNYQVKDQIIKIIENAFSKGYDDNDVQVLAPMYNGVAGIDALNKALQELCNPKEEGKRELHIGYRTFRENDKILQLKNQPDDNVYNGDIGKIVEIIYEKEDYAKKNRIIVDYDGVIVEYTSDNFAVITHAYCISIHKSQGSEYPIVIMPILKDYSYMLQRRLIYTGISRAKKSLVLLGDRHILQEGINKEERHPRKTKLEAKIRELFE